ncbi:MAG: hypothetical protein Q7J28_06645 [Caulobacter sp.]|nr:hypothetical protein [Caulobacter sp.]
MQSRRWSRWRSYLGLVITALSMFVTMPAHSQASPPDFSKISPEWAAQELDRSFQTGEARAAWKALKLAFPDDYDLMIRNLAQAIIEGRDLSYTSSISGRFIEERLTGEIEFAARAPVSFLVRYQRVRAIFIEELAGTNVPACAAMAQGAFSTALSDGSGTFYDLIGAFMDAAAAGRRDPQPIPPSLDTADVAALKLVMLNQGVPEVDANRVLFSTASAPPEDLCRYGVILNNALAAAPEDVVAKLAIRK